MMMKKFPLFIPAIVMFAILAILLVFMCLPLGQTPARAVSGNANISHTELDSSIWQLTGQWQYVPDKLLTADEFPDNAKTINLPDGWNDPINGCATYRLTIHTDAMSQLNIFVPEIYTAYKLYINGEYVRGAGKVSTDPKSGNPQFEASLNPVKAVGGQIEILIQASNYSFMRPHMNNLLLFGLSDDMNRWLFRTRSLYGLAMGFMLAAAFYHLALYVLRRKETVYLLFSLLCFVGFFRFSLDTNGMSDFTGWFSIGYGQFDMRFFTILFLLHAVLIGAFSLYVFEREWLAKRRWWFIGYGAAGAALFSLMPLNIPAAPIVVTLMLLPYMFFIIYKVARSRVLRENRMMWLYFTALILYTVVGAVSKSFFDHLLFMTGLVTNMYLIMAQSLIIAKQYTDLVEADQKLAFEHELLEQTSKIREDMVRTFSHEIRTPLAVMSAYTELAVSQLETGNVNEQTVSGLAVISDEAIRLGELAGNMLEQLKDTGEIPDDSQALPVNLTRITRQLVRLLEPSAARAGCTIDLRLDRRLITVCREDEVTQVLWNLLDNEVKHSGGSYIEIDGNLNDEFVYIIIVDSGNGIPVELLPRVFERGVSGGGGSGIGLSLSKEIVERYGGRIMLYSEYGSGTSVTIMLPVYKQSGESDEQYE